MSVLTKRLPTGRIEYKFRNRFGAYKRITEYNADHVSDLTDYGSLLDEVHNFDNTNEEIGEEIPLEEFEEVPLQESAFSSTPLLAESGGVAAAGTAAATPSATAVAVGVGIGLGTIAVGSTIGAIQRKQQEQQEHQDPLVSLPDHRYIGPGNTIDDTPPVDLDDSIAKEHDINYEKAKTQEDIQKADREGAHDFLSDFIDNKNVHSAIGYIGLKAKEKFESIVGVQYPPNLPTSVSGMPHSRVEIGRAHV